MFRIGQRVVIIKSDKVKKGATGMVAFIDEDKEKHPVAVFLTTPVSAGHDCDGLVPEGHGRYFAENQLVALLD